MSRDGDTIPQGPDGPDSNLDPTEIKRVPLLPEIPDVALKHEIARGGMGVVYRGRQEFLEREVAVKVLSAKLVHEEFAARFRREAIILADVQHPNIVTCHSAGTNRDGLCYLVMEFVDGPNLREWLAENGSLPLESTLRVARELALALQHAHLKNIIHRDIKPENVLLSKGTSTNPDPAFPWDIKLADLGLARFTHSDNELDLTAPGAVMGTVSTMSPEQFDSPDSVDHRTDIYGLGCVMFHALTGKPAFSRSSMTTAMAEKRAMYGPDVCEHGADVPENVAKLIKRMLAHDREDRPATYAELLEELEALLAGTATRPRVVTPPADDDRQVETDEPTDAGGGGVEPSRGKLVAAIAAVCLLGGATWWAFEYGPFATIEQLKETDPPIGNGDDDPDPPPDPPPVNRAPTLELSVPANCREGIPIELTATATDPDGDDLSYRWKQVDGPSGDLMRADQATAMFVLKDGSDPTAMVEFEVTCADERGESVDRSFTVEVHVVDEPLFRSDRNTVIADWRTEDPDGFWFEDTTEDGGVILNGRPDGQPLVQIERDLEEEWRLDGWFAPLDWGVRPDRVGIAVKFTDDREIAVALKKHGDGYRTDVGLDGVAATDWAKLAPLRFVLIRTKDKLALIWMNGADGEPAFESAAEVPPGTVTLRLFVEGDGAAGQFVDLRRH